LNQQKIQSFDGLYGDTEGKYQSEYIFLELIATRSQTFDWIIKPHLHAHLFQVFIIKKGHLIFKDNTKAIRLSAPCIISIPPSFVHGLEYSSDIDGSILSVSDGIIEDIFKTSEFFLRVNETIQIIEEFNSDYSFETFNQLLAKLEFELFGDLKDREILIRSLLSQFFAYLFRYLKEVPINHVNTASLVYFRKFQQLIKSSKKNKSVIEFADELQISSVHLNRICKQVSGKSAIELIHQNILNEAQKYLLHTSYSISEIAYLLNFEYPNYFAKWFRKNTNCSPLEYRSKDRS
jgi:AraC family transcriptional regulator, transcriptional activator of pobA